MESINSEDIVQFCAITSADPDVASNYLTVCDGSLDRAITLYMESGGIDLSGTTSTSSSANNNNISRGERRSRSSSNDGSGDFGGGFDQDEELARSLQEDDSRAAQSIRAPIAPRHEMLLGDDFGGHSSSIFHGGSSRARAAPSVFLPPYSSTFAQDGFRDFAAEAATMGGDTSPKTSRLADLFKAPLDMMARGDFDQSRNVAKRETKWLMVNIQEAGVFACQVLNRDLWSDQSVKEIVKENFIFLQFYSDSVEGKKYAAYYPLKTFPHIAIIDPRTAERIHTWSKTIDPVDFLSDVSEFLDLHSLTDSASKPSLPKKKKIVKDVSDMTEEEQLQAAMMASMGGDASNTIEIPDDEPEAVSTPVDEDEPIAEIEVVEESVFDSIKPVRHEEPTDLATSTRIGFRLSDGSRLMHRFPKSAPVRALFEYIKSEVEDARSQPFELVFIGKPLLDYVDKTLTEVGVENAQIMVQM
ncbi:hypothetical protein BGZ95_009993 [Linnemannia exigua]|uniref:UBX domain-containing protein n=1 Tax=Linnemannia exigua TaxID=604196 RepID=A0AAD4H679_9FUNG|nr:hypothetical protein BGZ95_009993 [Linnemannia exigua]